MSKGGLRPIGGRNFRDPTVFVDGKPIGAEFIEEQYYANQYARYDRLISHNPQNGTITVAGKTEYLTSAQVDRLDAIEHKLNGTGYSAGDLLDWGLRLAVRPKSGSNITAMMSYGFRSAFIDVSNDGQNDGLFNRLLAEAISICFELFIDVVSVRTSKEQPEEAVRKGFEAIANARNKGISKELLGAMDDHFDLLAEALQEAVEKQQGYFKGLTKEALPELSMTMGEGIANKLKKLSPEAKQKLIDDPVAVLEFYNEQLKPLGIKPLQSDWVDKYKQQRAESQTLRAENAELKNRIAGYEKTTAGNGLDSLQETKKEANWWKKFTNRIPGG